MNFLPCSQVLLLSNPHVIIKEVWQHEIPCCEEAKETSYCHYVRESWAKWSLSHCSYLMFGPWRAGSTPSFPPNIGLYVETDDSTHTPWVHENTYYSYNQAFLGEQGRYPVKEGVSSSSQTSKVKSGSLLYQTRWQIREWGTLHWSLAPNHSSHLQPLKSSHLRSQESWRTDKPSPLCSVWNFDTQIPWAWENGCYFCALIFQWFVRNQQISWISWDQGPQSPRDWLPRLSLTMNSKVVFLTWQLTPDFAFPHATGLLCSPPMDSVCCSIIPQYPAGLLSSPVSRQDVKGMRDSCACWLFSKKALTASSEASGVSLRTTAQVFKLRLLSVSQYSLQYITMIS